MHHVHHDIIVAWAKGAKIEWFDALNDTWATVGSPTWNSRLKYRIKPEPKPDVVIYGTIHATNDGPTHRLSAACRIRDSADNLMLIFDGETGKLKDAQVLANSGLASSNE